MANGTPTLLSTTLSDDPNLQPTPRSRTTHLLSQRTSSDSFKHEPLDHSQPSIRLIKISPRLSDEGLIRCSMSHTTMDRGPYRCLSYTWGQPEPKQLISINGKSSYVQPNLHEFSKVVKADITRTRHLYWIDALCIDQENTAERNHQVTQMGQIYSEAEVVIAWLGPASEETLLHYHGNMPSTYDRFSTTRTIYEDLAGNEYWTRAWITQELVLAHCISIAIGPLTFTFKKLLEMVHSIGFEFAITEEFGQILAFTASKGNIVGEPLAKLLLTFRNKQCSVSRDRIFALLGLCLEKDHIKVDYGCSVIELVHSIMRSTICTFCVCTTLIVMKSLEPDIVDPTWKEGFRYEEGPYIEIDVIATDWVNLGGRNKCKVLSSLCAKVFAATGTNMFDDGVSCAREHAMMPTRLPAEPYSTEPRKHHADGCSFVSTGRGLGTMRISLWYLFELYGRERLAVDAYQLCSRSWRGTDESMTSMRMGYGNWDINAVGSLSKKAETLKSDIADGR